MIPISPPLQIDSTSELEQGEDEGDAVMMIPSEPESPNNEPTIELTSEESTVINLTEREKTPEERELTVAAEKIKFQITVDDPEQD